MYEFQTGRTSTARTASRRCNRRTDRRRIVDGGTGKGE
jgi:hypothetical protein